MSDTDNSPPSTDIPQRTVELVRAAQNGDAGALDSLFARYVPYVTQIVALRMGRRLRQMVEVEDVVQEVLLDVFRSLDRFEPRSEGSFRNWLARCVEREVVDMQRTETRQKRGGGAVRRFADCNRSILHTSIFGQDLAGPSAHVRAEELAERLEDALLDMPAYQRELIILRAVCGMSHGEIAAELGISEEGAVRVAYSRALRKLEERVEV